MDCCSWIWDRMRQRYTVIGPNGKHIFLPVEGFVCCAGPCHVHEGHYWTSECRDRSVAVNVFLTKNKRMPDSSYRNVPMSVRTVKPSR